MEPAKVIKVGFEVVREMSAVADLLSDYKEDLELRAIDEAALLLKYDSLEEAFG